jgi:hypothetical protein
MAEWGGHFFAWVDPDIAFGTQRESNHFRYDTTVQVRQQHIVEQFVSDAGIRVGIDLDEAQDGLSSRGESGFDKAIRQLA